MTSIRQRWACCGALVAALACGQEEAPMLPYAALRPLPYTGDATTLCAPVGVGGWIAGVEFLKLRASAPGSDFAFSNLPAGGAAIGGQLSVRELGIEPRPDAGFRLSAGYRDAAGFDTVVRWFNFHGDAFFRGAIVDLFLHQRC